MIMEMEFKLPCGLDTGDIPGERGIETGSHAYCRNVTRNEKKKIHNHMGMHVV
jgi:hypothetical protein